MTLAEVLVPTRNHPLLATLAPAVLKQTVDASKLVRYRAKRTFLREGDLPEQAYLLLKGAVRVYHRAADGTELLLKLFRGPAMFGEMEVMASRPFLEYVTTLEPSEILEIPRRVFLQLLERQPAFARAVALDLAARLCIAADNLKAVAFCQLETRLANLLLDYAELFGVADGLSVRLDVGLTQDAMAKDLAVTRQAVAATLASLKEQGVLEKREGRYVICQIEALRHRASATLSLSFTSDDLTQVRRPRT